MNHLLSIEYSKLKKLSSLKAILLVYMAVGPLWMIVYTLLLQSNPAFSMLLGSTDEMYSFPNIWNYTTWSMSCFNILLGVSVVIITCNEIHFKTMRQNVIDGMSKGSVIMSRFLVIVSLSALVTVYTALVALVFGITYSGFSGIGENIHYLFVYFLQTLGYFSVAFLLASIIRKPALSIILFIFIFPIEGISSLFVPHDIAGFLPLRSMSGLTPFPFRTLEAMMSKQNKQPAQWIMPVWMYVVTASVYIGIIFSFTYYLLKRRDL